jgi:hypothetical protein
VSVVVRWVLAGEGGGEKDAGARAQGGVSLSRCEPRAAPLSPGDRGQALERLLQLLCAHCARRGRGRWERQDGDKLLYWVQIMSCGGEETDDARGMDGRLAIML